MILDAREEDMFLGNCEEDMFWVIAKERCFWVVAKERCFWVVAKEFLGGFKGEFSVQKDGEIQILRDNIPME